jgi:uncharacterized membrane protein YfcA
MPAPESLAYVAAVFVLAGWIKGVVGMGLPTVVIGVLGLAMAPVHAAALLVVPSLVTNVWQFAAGPARWPIARRLASMMVCICLGTAIGIRFLTSGSSRWPSVALGAVLSVYALIALLLPRLAVPAKSEPRLAPLVGAATGVLTGATGVFAVPAVPYLSALGLSRDELVQALGLSFTVCTVALAVALGSSGHYPPATLLASTAAVVPTVVGMLIGQRTRGRIDPIAFRRWFFVAMLLVGVYMVARGLRS